MLSISSSQEAGVRLAAQMEGEAAAQVDLERELVFPLRLAPITPLQLVEEAQETLIQIMQQTDQIQFLAPLLAQAAGLQKSPQTLLLVVLVAEHLQQQGQIYLVEQEIAPQPHHLKEIMAVIVSEVFRIRLVVAGAHQRQVQMVLDHKVVTAGMERHPQLAAHL